MVRLLFPLMDAAFEIHGGRSVGETVIWANFGAPTTDSPTLDTYALLIAKFKD